MELCLYTDSVPELTLEAFVRFEAWDVAAKAFVPLGDIDAEMVEDGTAKKDDKPSSK